MRFVQSGAELHGYVAALAMLIVTLPSIGWADFSVVGIERELFVAVLARYLERPMRGRVGGPCKKRFSISAPRIDLLDQVIGIKIARVREFRRKLREFHTVLAVAGNWLIDTGPADIVVHCGAIEQGEALLKTTRTRGLTLLVAEMPLAGHIGMVAGIPEQRGEADDPVV